MALICAECGTPAPEGARFCRRCGRALKDPIAVASPGAGQGGRTMRIVAIAALALTAVVGGIGSYFYESTRILNEDQRRKIEAEARIQAEARFANELRAARKRVEEAEQARIDAEQQAAHAQGKQDIAQREAAAARSEIKATAERAAAKNALARKQADEKLQQETAERRRAEEAAAAASARVAALSARPAPPPPPARLPADVQVAQASPEQLCRSANNFILRGLCEARECFKPQFAGSEYCRSLRARAPQRDQP